MQSNLTTFIYALIDPRNQHVRYIGKSDNPNDRYEYHLYDTVKSKKVSWIKSLRSIGLKPELFILDEVDINEWKFWECHYISLYKSFGFKLTNGTNGGDGTSKITSEETKNKISLACKGKKKSPRSKEHCDKIRNWHLGRKMKPCPQERKDKISKSNIGKIRSQKTRVRISIAATLQHRERIYHG